MIEPWVIAMLVVSVIVLLALSFSSGFKAGNKSGWHKATDFYKGICRNNCPYRVVEKKSVPYLRRIK